MKRRHLTDEQIRKLPRKTNRYTLADPELIGHYLRVPARKSKAPVTFVAVVRRDGRQKWKTLGSSDTLRLSQARERARREIGKAQHGLTVSVVAESWLQREVRAKGFRTARDRERIVEKHIVPHIGDRAMADVRRSDLTAMLDHVEDAHGPIMADAVLKVFAAISRWHHQRHDDYSVPVTRGMWRSPRVRRERTLADAEIRAVWMVDGPYGDFVKLALLTAQRRDKLRTLQWEDVSNGIWALRKEPREKGAPTQLKLPQIALDIIGRQPRFAGNPFVFAGRKGATTTFGAGRCKKRFDELCDVSGWRVHDLRRTARSLMSRAEVQTEIAEMVLGHARGELIETYDRHSYQDEMADALTKLAELIKQIMSSP